MTSIVKSSQTTLAMGALGVVFGDIGTSPLYAVKEVFTAHHLPLVQANILGILSLIFWSLMLVVSLKYVSVMMRADNKGEGGILALLALTQSHVPLASRTYKALMILGLLGASLFFGDSLITPAISVLSAIEGLEVATDVLHPLIVPLALVILVGLFVIQQHGTATIGKLFGPVMVVWFGTLAVLGVINILHHPVVLNALLPVYGIRFFTQHGMAGFLVLGSVVLAITGAEALYADMGHFGRIPIQQVWFIYVLPALVINYFGQGALLLGNAAALKNPFYLLAPSFLLYPMIALATLATIIASQAVISGTFSMTRQIILMGYAPPPWHSSHIGLRVRTNLHSFCQLVADDRCCHPCAWFSRFRSSGRGLRHRRHWHVRDQYGTHVDGHAHTLESQSASHPHWHAGFSWHRVSLFWRQCGQDSGWRLATPRTGPCGLHVNGDLETGPGNCRSTSRRKCHSSRRIRPESPGQSTGAGIGHGPIPDQRAFRRAYCASA
jgi:hypothetical protein